MSTHKDVNPFRPYYIPPTIGQPVEPPAPPDPTGLAHGHSAGKYTSTARDIFPDIDYKSYLSEPSPSVVQICAPAN